MVHMLWFIYSSVYTASIGVFMPLMNTNFGLKLFEVLEHTEISGDPAISTKR